MARSISDPLRGVLIALGLVILASCGMPPREDLPQVSPSTDWAKWPEGTVVGEVSAVDVDSHGHVFVLHRPGRDWAEPFPDAPIPAAVVAMFDPTGKLLAQWGEGQTSMPHGLTVAPDDTVLITDVQREQVLRFSHEGNLLEAFGERGVSGDDAGHFGRPTDAEETPRGIFVADGYRNNRVVRIAENWRWWGEKAGTDAGFHTPHSISAQDGRLIVADREYSRIKIYDENGRLHAIYPQAGPPYAAKYLPDGRMVVIQGRDKVGRDEAVLRLLGRDGKEQNAIDLSGDKGMMRGHDLAIGRDGTIYIADVLGRQVLTLPLATLTKD